MIAQTEVKAQAQSDNNMHQLLDNLRECLEKLPLNVVSAELEQQILSWQATHDLEDEALCQLRQMKKGLHFFCQIDPMDSDKSFDVLV